MKKFNNLFRLSVLALVILAFASCSKTENSFNVIPSNSTVVVVVDGASIASKTGIESFTNTKTYSLLKKEVGEEDMEGFKSFEPIFENTAESGIDFKKDFFFYTYKKDGANYMSFYFNLLDASKFEAAINKINETENENLTIVKDGGYSYLYEEGAPFLMWNDKKLLFIITTQGDVTKENYIAETKALLNQKSENSINSNEDFAGFIKNQKDVNMWMDYSVFYDNLPPMQKMMIQSNLPYDMSGTLIHAYIDFQKGKMVTSYDVVMNDEMKSFMADNNLIKNSFDTDILSVLPKKSFANFSVAIDFLNYFNLVKSIMKENQQNVDQIDEQFKAATGMTIKEALNEFSGEMTMNVHRIAIADVEKTDYMAYYQAGGEGDISLFKKTEKQPVVYYSIAVEMNNDKVFNIIIQNLGASVQKTGDYYTLTFGGAPSYMGLYGKNMVYTNDPILINSIASGEVGTESLKNSEVASHLKDYPAYAFVDLNMDNYPEEVQTAIASMMGEEDYDVFSKMISGYSKLEIIPKSMKEAKMILWMKDDSKNSLEVMLKSFDDNIEAIAD